MNILFIWIIIWSLHPPEKINMNGHMLQA